MEFKSKDFTDAKRVLKIRGLTVGLAGLTVGVWLVTMTGDG